MAPPRRIINNEFSDRRENPHSTVLLDNQRQTTLIKAFPAAYGIYCEALDLHNQDPAITIPNSFDDLLTKASTVYPKTTRWIMSISLFSQALEGFVIGPAAHWIIGLSESGQLLFSNVGALFYYTDLYIFRNQFHPERGQRTPEEVAQIFWVDVLPGLLGLSFLHCKNVVVSESLPTRAERRRANREQNAFSRYHILTIELMKTILREEGHIESIGLKKALHICRGHFAEYGAAFGKGKLFGKVEGRFWIPQHVKGSMARGVVRKDYSINSPTSGVGS